MPSGWLESTVFNNEITAFTFATIVSLPLYVCATASIPMAYAFVAGGFSPGAALVFLIVGPATNTATVATVWKLLGRRAVFFYIFSLILIAWLAGWIFNMLPEFYPIEIHKHDNHCEQISIWQQITAVLLLSNLSVAYITNRRAASNK